MESLKHTAMLVLLIPLFLIHGALSGHIGAEAGPPTLKVRPLSPDRHITVGDRALSDWDRSLVVMEIDAQSAPLKQWKTLNRGVPLPLKQGDIELTVFMSWSDSDWYIAGDARDDAVVGGPASSQYPYSGDCVEIFFAGKNLNSKADLHDYVESPRTPDEAAFIQLDLPASQLGDPAFYLPDWRTDTSLKARALKSGGLCWWAWRRPRTGQTAPGACSRGTKAAPGSCGRSTGPDGRTGLTPSAAGTGCS